MKHVSIPVGISKFEKIRKDGYYYIDKTGLISDLLESKAEVTLITRPRRFGKTLGMSMLEAFFDIRKDSRSLFEGLEIANRPDLCKQWMNQYPTIFLSFRSVDGLDFGGAYGMLVKVISELYKEHLYLLESEKISDYDKAIMRQIIQEKASVADIKRSLMLLTRVMECYYEKPVILLMDEYDVPVAKANDHGYYREMLDIMKGIMQTMKDNSSLMFAVITGCLRIAKESIFTGTNNFVLDTISDARLSEYFGFTQMEVDRMLKDFAVFDRKEEIKAWYDGYHFGEIDVYCPWDVMNYLRDLQRNPKAKPASYWKNTSDNAIIRSFIEHAGSTITKKLEVLLSGGSITQRVDDELTYDYLYSSEDNLWSILYLTGYLTKVRDADQEDELPENTTALRIPNTEIKEIFETTVLQWFDDSVKKWDRNVLFDAVWNGNSKKITAEMSALLRRTISYHDYKEDFYHAFLAGIFTGAGYMVDSNKEHGEGRSDVVVYDPINGRVAVFEAKYAKSLEKLEATCDKALNQIDNKMYAKEYEDDYDEILCYGISFYKKRCVVKKR